MPERIILTESMEQTAIIFGSFDINIQAVEKAFGVSIRNRDTEKTAGDAIVITGEDDQAVADAAAVIGYLKKMSRFNDELSLQSVEYVLDMVRAGQADELGSFDEDCVCVTTRGKPIKAKTVGQRKYVEQIKKNTIVLGVGPAGTGKTFLAVAMAVTALRNKEIERIILTRPAVEAGEKLGYLPGDLQNKIDPYLRPLYDALYEMLGPENYQRHLEKGTIEIAPLAYMRGRTLDDSFIILDEAQNTTPEQMKMFLTRLGFNSKAVVTGDITQTDLPFGKKSGLMEAVKVLKDIEDIAIHRFSERDVVRHRLVQKIILAYEKYDKERATANEKERPRHFYKG
ncbi:MAG: PhoH family protein [Clostridia bacterium]|nr:PhoH family protein [Clostridia bacterium]